MQVSCPHLNLSDVTEQNFTSRVLRDAGRYMLADFDPKNIHLALSAEITPSANCGPITTFRGAHHVVQFLERTCCECRLAVSCCGCWHA